MAIGIDVVLAYVRSLFTGASLNGPILGKIKNSHISYTVCEKTLAPLYLSTVAIELLHYFGILKADTYMDLCVIHLRASTNMCSIMNKSRTLKNDRNVG